MVAAASLSDRQRLVGDLPATFDTAAVAEIRQRLNQVRASGVSILFAIESGSRAWGFPSPDSDYDCRFVYLRPPRDHFVLRQHRDVIEFPIVGEVDTGGWDLRKALLLALNGNAVIHEWLVSPLVYEEIAGFRAALGELLQKILIPAKVAQHYLGLAQSQFDRFGGGDTEIPLKKLFYSIRPLVALTWMEERGFSSLPPMNMPECLAGTAIDADIRAAIDELIARKAQTRELGEGDAPQPLLRFLHSSMQRLPPLVSEASPTVRARDEHYELAESFYRQIVDGAHPVAPNLVP